MSFSSDAPIKLPFETDLSLLKKNIRDTCCKTHIEEYLVRVDPAARRFYCEECISEQFGDSEPPGFAKIFPFLEGAYKAAGARVDRAINSARTAPFP